MEKKKKRKEPWDVLSIGQKMNEVLGMSLPQMLVWHHSPQQLRTCTLLKFMSVELVMLSNHLILFCSISFCFQSFPASGSFPMSRLFAQVAKVYLKPPVVSLFGFCISVILAFREGTPSLSGGTPLHYSCLENPMD